MVWNRESPCRAVTIEVIDIAAFGIIIFDIYHIVICDRHHRHQLLRYVIIIVNIIETRRRIGCRRHQRLQSGSEFLRLQSLQCRRPPILLLLSQSCRLLTLIVTGVSCTRRCDLAGFQRTGAQELAPRQGLRRRTGCPGLTAATRLAAIRCFGVLG